MASQSVESVLQCSTKTGPAYLVLVDKTSAPQSLISYLCEVFNSEVDAADTYPHNDHFDLATFTDYWFGYAGIILLAGSADLGDDRDWRKELLGTYYIKPNYIGHCKHICNAGFLVPLTQRQFGCNHSPFASKVVKLTKLDGKVLARSFPHFASRLGYRSSVFNLVFESNVASLRLWDQLGYRRVGRLQDAIKIRGKWTAAIIYQGDFLDGSIDTTFKDLS